MKRQWKKPKCEKLWKNIKRIKEFVLLWLNQEQRKLFSEAATKTVFKISVLFFQEQPFHNFPGGSIFSSNRHKFSGRVYLFVEQTLLSQRKDTNFPRNTYLVIEHIRIFQEPLFSLEQISIFQEPLFSFRSRYSFSRKPYLVLEHIQFSRRPYASNR